MRFGRKKKKDDGAKWLQVGNFLLGVDTNKDFSSVVLKSVSGNWRVSWREDTLMFSMMLNAMRRAAVDDNVKEYLHSLITVMFVSTTYLHDLVALSTKGEMPFCEGIAKLLKEQTDYEQSLEKKPTEEEEAEALKDVGETEQINEELEEIENEQEE